MRLYFKQLWLVFKARPLSSCASIVSQRLDPLVSGRSKANNPKPAIASPKTAKESDGTSLPIEAMIGEQAPATTSACLSINVVIPKMLRAKQSTPDAPPSKQFTTTELLLLNFSSKIGAVTPPLRLGLRSSRYSLLYLSRLMELRNTYDNPDPNIMIITTNVLRKAHFRMNKSLSEYLWASSRVSSEGNQIDTDSK